MKLKQTYYSFKSYLQKNSALKLAFRTLSVFILIALFANILANDKPLVCKYKQNWMFPAFSAKNNYRISSNEILNYNMGKEWKLISCDFILFPPCAYSPKSIDAENAPRKSPFDKQYITQKNGVFTSLPLKFRHWLGTTQNGNDVLSNLIHGTQIAISISIFSMLIASIIGILLGAIAGYFENNGLKTGYIQLLLMLFGVFLTWFYCFIIRGNALTEAFTNGGFWLFFRILFLLYISFKTIIGFGWIGRYIDRKLRTDKKINFPADMLISRTIEVLNSIPALLLIIAISAISKPSYTLLIFIIGFLSWTTIARLTRAEFLKAKQLDYVTSCKAIGMSSLKIIQKQILPNVLPVILVQIVFGMSGAVLAEASLSFIGIGVPVNSASWGNLLNEGRDHFSSWWLVLAPGLCLFILILCYNTISKQLGKRKPDNI